MQWYIQWQNFSIHWVLNYWSLHDKGLLGSVPWIEHWFISFQSVTKSIIGTQCILECTKLSFHFVWSLEFLWPVWYCSCEFHIYVAWYLHKLIHVSSSSLGWVWDKRNPADMPLIGRMWMIFLDRGSYWYGIFTKYDMIMFIEFL